MLYHFDGIYYMHYILSHLKNHFEQYKYWAQSGVFILLIEMLFYNFII